MDADLDRLRSALDGQFRVEHEIGRGGMGVVYRAHDLKLDRVVAIKTLPSTLATDPTVRERFLREARTAAKLTHPNIVPVFRADDADGVAYIVMAFIDGTTLAGRGPLPAPDAIPILVDAARALGYAHAHGVIHRDIKPENILVDRATGRALVTDFGIARATITGATTTPLTSTGQVMGTTQFMSPEQATGEPLDGRSDLYSLGVVAYYLLSGHVPFEGSPNAVMVAHVTRTPPPLTDIPPALAAIINRCLAKLPSDRPPTGEALAEALIAPLTPITPSPDAPRLAESEAARIWHRAASMQSEATGQEVRGELAPSASYSLVHVKSAAQDAGIDPSYVALALSEIALDRAAGRSDNPSFFDKAGPFLLGITSSVLTASITIPFPVERVFHAVGRVLHDTPYGLDLADEAGGILLFALPPTGSMNARAWLNVTQQGARHLRVALRATANGASTEVTMYADLRHPTRTGVLGTLYVDTCASVGGAALGVAIATKLALATIAVAGLGLGAALPITLGVGAGMRAIWRNNRRGAVAEMHRALAAVQAMLRTTDVFGRSP